MEFKTMTMDDLLEQGKRIGEMDALEVQEFTKALAVANGVELDAVKERKLQAMETFDASLKAMIKPETLDVSFAKNDEVKVSFTIKKGSKELHDYSRSGSHASPTASPYKGCTFTIDGESMKFFDTASGCHLDHGNLEEGKAYSLNACKYVWMYFGGQIRSEASKAEATVTSKLATLTDEQKSRVAVVLPSKETVSLVDFLASI